MKNAAIKVFARIRPTNNTSPRRSRKGEQCQRDLYEVGEDVDSLELYIPSEVESDTFNNRCDHYRYKFKHVFEPEATQDSIYEKVGKPSVQRALEGYNSTVFAYGQTGSGKTYTITGGPEGYADRGLIPRALSHIFRGIQNCKTTIYTVRISYLEIYNDDGYDLLDPTRNGNRLADLQKVKMMENEDGDLFVQNISTLAVKSETDAMKLLLLGDTNRRVSETTHNHVSSRSHCIFTVNIWARDVEGDTVRTSKLHLVDLAGSERMSSNSTSNESTLIESRHINLSLHFLQQVIVALHQKKHGHRSHIPYRNSMMTSFLRDSLGGNCETAMVATVSINEHNMQETISTCRFAQRVAMIANHTRINEEVDPQAVITRLKEKIKQLQLENSMLKGEPNGESSGDVLTSEERESCESLARKFVSNVSTPLEDPRKVQACLSVLREVIMNSPVRKLTDELGQNHEDRAVAQTNQTQTQAILPPKQYQSAPRHTNQQLRSHTTAGYYATASSLKMRRSWPYSAFYNPERTDTPDEIVARESGVNGAGDNHERPNAAQASHSTFQMSPNKYEKSKDNANNFGTNVGFANATATSVRHTYKPRLAAKRWDSRRSSENSMAKFVGASWEESGYDREDDIGRAEDECHSESSGSVEAELSRYEFLKNLTYEEEEE
eukprot:781280_1